MELQVRLLDDDPRYPLNAVKKLAISVDLSSDPDEAFESTAPPPPPVHGFNSLMLDGDSQLLQQSYRLRYQVYCVERGFLAVENYPNEVETDSFDAHSLHVGTLDPFGALVGSARLVRPSQDGLPIFDHCPIFPDAELPQGPARLVEVSRLAVSRRYRRPGNGSGALVVTLYRSLYEVSKALGYTHWLAATEPSLQRLVAKFGFPFRQIGPEIDYFGPVAPYLMDLSEFDRIILSGKHAVLATFREVLERALASSPQLAGGAVTAA